MRTAASASARLGRRLLEAAAARAFRLREEAVFMGWAPQSIARRVAGTCERAPLN